MKTRIAPIQISRRQQEGLTLVEIMVASTLLLMILLGLMLMFDQTQKAFRSGIKQNDIMETGRSTLDIIARDIEQMVAAYDPEVVNAQVQLHSAIPPLKYTPPGGSEQTNFLQTFFFLRKNSEWEGTGYRVLNSAINLNRVDETNNILVGALYRYQTNSVDLKLNEHLFTFHNPPLPMVTNGTMRRLADGVVHFRITMFDREGRIYTNTAWPGIEVDAPFNGLRRVNLRDSALPVTIDLEIGILEPQALDRLRPLITDGNQVAIRTFLQNNAGKLHIFRRQIPIRTAAR